MLHSLDRFVMNLIHLAAKVPDKIVNLLGIAVLVTIAGTLSLESWRASALAPLSGLACGVLFGWFAVMQDSGGWIVFWTLFGAIAGPNVILVLSGKGFAESLARAMLRRVGADEPKDPPEDTA